MSLGDIMPLRGTDQGNALPAFEWGRLGAGETFVQGEPVSINAAGYITESASNPGADDFAGIAASSGDTVGATDARGTFRESTSLFTPGASPNLPQTGDKISFWRAKGGRKFITANVSTGGVGVLVTPTAAMIGDAVGLLLNGGVWFIDSNAGTTKLGRITNVLDAKGESIITPGNTGATGVFAVVEFGAEQLTSVAVPLA